MAFYSNLGNKMTRCPDLCPHGLWVLRGAGDDGLSGVPFRGTSTLSEGSAGTVPAKP